VDGGGWSTTITLTNLDTKRVKTTVYFLTETGTDMMVTINDLGPARAVDVTLEPYGSLSFDTAGASPSLQVGWAYLVKDTAGANVSGLCVFRQHVSGRPDFEAVVPIVSEFENHFILLYDNTNGYTTALALANPDITPITANFIIRGESPKVLDNAKITLGKFAHTAGTVSGTFPATIGRRGTVEITATGFGVGVIGLRFNPGGAFTSFNVLSNLDWLQ
jgi:hypothetical protein